MDQNDTMTPAGRGAAPPPRRSMRAQLIGSGLLAVGLAAAAAGVGVSAAGLEQTPVAAATSTVAGASALTGWSAGANPGGPGGHGGHGGVGGRGGGALTITAINGTQLSLATGDGWTRTIDAAGVSVTSGTTAVALGDLKVGDEIALQQARNFDGTFEVTRISLVAPHVDGTVTAVTGDNVTIQTIDGATRSVTLTSSTTFSAGRTSATKDAVTVGSVAHVEGTSNADGTFTANSVAVRPASLGGTVTATTADSITVADASGATATISVTSATTYRTATGAGTLASVTIGSIVRAEGVKNADGSLTATAVRVGSVDGGFGDHGYRVFGGGPGRLAPADAGASGSAGPSA